LRIGIFGGTFNPIHFGHLRPVEEIRMQFSLHRIYFVLANIPPHKRENNLVSAKERYSILKYAVKDNPFFFASSIEMRRKKPSYSFDTIKYFKKKYPDDEIFFIMGSDAFAEFDTWFKYEKISALVDIIVMLRENFKCDNEFTAKLGYEKKGNYLTNDFGKKVFFINVTRFDISSSMIRDLISKKESVKYFLPQKCLNYIVKKKLYTEKESQ
jgi:nicotinate-nucleotide adenylyltransferase